MKLIFRGDPIEIERGLGLSRQSITLEGVTFALGVPTDASALSPRLQAKLRNNSHFEVVVEDAPAAIAPAVADASDEEAAEAAAHAARAAAKKAARAAKE